MSNVIAVIVLAVIIGAAVGYIVRSRKKGAKCIGCPAGDSCSMKNIKALEHSLEQSKHECGCQSGK
ncbi:MAG TPA: hypothetical protein IAC50_02495 [Candidatus Copromorpha excrementigallinarum]|uniref:FeoB-associated Cys-rich membrane protein n=1 Tax=Candidatus Allocopromorpha excrementigallinarum TaxID=2840742 RepID=A0A9D1L5X2_9FIRM|nr:hypothetical protein [Candidatus Copromorpha excrementigallinarum]